MPDYAIYGLTIRSDRALPSLPPAAGATDDDVRIFLGGAPALQEAWPAAPLHYREPADSAVDATVEVRRTADRGFWFRYDDGTEFVLDAAAREIRARWASTSTLEDTATYLLGPVLGFALRLRGVLALHASAVVVDGRAVALIGPSGAGKSTTAAAFAAAGVPVITDDVLAVRCVAGEWMAYPAYPTLRLWDESERLLFGSVGQLPLLTPTWEKRGLPLGADYPFYGDPAPLGALFVLAPRVADATAPRVEPLTASEGFMALVANSYANYLLDDVMRAAEMRALERLLRGRPVRRLVPPSDAHRLSRLVDVVRAASGTAG